MFIADKNRVKIVNAGLNMFKNKQRIIITMINL